MDNPAWPSARRKAEEAWVCIIDGSDDPDFGGWQKGGTRR
jgi:hypothetical protein